MMIPQTEGQASFPHPSLPRPATTWYKVFGDVKSDKSPLIILHGGPGACHECMLPYADLAHTLSIPVVFYDQIGNGQSTHYPEKMGDGDFWTPQLFADELDNLIDHLDLRSRGFSILGHSWGGMLAAFCASSRPRGLRRLVLASSPASLDLWAEAAQNLSKTLPAGMHEVLQRCDDEDDYESDAYKEAIRAFEQRFVCRAEPYPCPELQVSQEHFAADPTTVMTMCGPKTLSVSGSLNGWSTVAGLNKIEVPTLLLNGEYDGAQDSCVAPFFEHIPKVRWVTVRDASHFPHVEQREKTMRIVGDFLRPSLRL